MKNKERENAKNVKNDDDFTFALQHKAHLKSVYKWIMDLEATKHMILYRAAFDTYEVISLYNVRLGNDSVVETIVIRSIVINVEMKGKMNKICITNVLHMLKLQANSLLVSKLLLNEMKMWFHVNECIVGGANGDMIAIAQSEGNYTKWPSRRYMEHMWPTSCIHVQGAVRWSLTLPV